jgi:hypothetical protein
MRAKYNIAITNLNHFNFLPEQDQTSKQEAVISLAQGEGAASNSESDEETNQQDGFFNKLMSSAQIRAELPPKDLSDINQ